MKPQLSHRDLVKLGLHESAHGRSLNQIEADFHQKKIDKNAAIRALKAVDYINKREARKANQKIQAAKLDNKNTGPKNEKTAEAAGKNKSNFLFWVLVLFILFGIGYLFYEGILSLEIFGINFK